FRCEGRLLYGDGRIYGNRRSVEDARIVSPLSSRSPMFLVRGSLMTADPGDASTARFHPPRQTEPRWFRWLNRLVSAMRGLSARRAEEGHEPIFRIAQISHDRWVVERPGAVIEHAFSDLEHAVAFVRNENAAPATVELRIGDLYIVARFDPQQ